MEIVLNEVYWHNKNKVFLKCIQIDKKGGWSKEINCTFIDTNNRIYHWDKLVMSWFLRPVKTINQFNPGSYYESDKHLYIYKGDGLFRRINYELNSDEIRFNDVQLQSLYESDFKPYRQQS